MGAVAHRAWMFLMLGSGCSFTANVQGDAKPIDGSDSEGMEMPPVSSATCKAIHTSMPSAPSGPYMIDPDGVEGADAPLMVYCDMTTDGGGWTVIFSPASSNFSSQTLTYTSSTDRLLNDSVQVMLAYRDSTGAMTPTNERAFFPLPQEWRLAAPFTYSNMDLPVTATVNGASSVNGTLKFGNRSFTADRCSDAWELSTRWGRLCIEGTAAPFYTAFAETVGDTCSDSQQTWNARACSPSVRFTIAVR